MQCISDEKALCFVRPAYMDEYEKLQGDLQGLFTTYMEKFRNLEWLESQLEQHNRKEQERMDETERALKRMQRRIKDEVGFLVTLGV
jgi:clusterin-associated protein 1